MRSRAIVVSRALWIPGLIVATVYLAFNAFIVFSSAYCCGNPWDGFPWLTLIIAFVICMVVALAGIVVRRLVAHPSPQQHALWLAAGIGWCGALCFGIGSAGSSFYVSTAFGGGEVTFLLSLFGMLAFVAAVLLAAGALTAIWAGPAPTIEPVEEPPGVLRNPVDGIL